MRIRRSRLTRDYIQVPNATARDDRLSHMARGILVDLLSRPDGWEATADDMWRASVAKHGKASPGRRVFRAAFAELKEYGYLTPSREVLKGGKHSTVLTLTDISAGRTDVPDGGTSVRPGTTDVSAGRSDVPHAGTSDEATDVPHAGTSVPPAETGNAPDGADVPHGGTSAWPAETGISAGRSDVPHAGTSNTENGEKKTGKKTSSAVAATSREFSDEEMKEYGNFWLLHPKSKNPDDTLELWKAAVASGVDPKEITAAAVAYAKEKAGEPFRFIKQSDNWLRERRYMDKFAPEPNGKPHLRSVGPQTAPRDMSHMTPEEKRRALSFG